MSIAALQKRFTSQVVPADPAARAPCSGTSHAAPSKGEEASLPWLLIERANQKSQAPAVRARRGGIWRTFSWLDVLTEVALAARGLAELGVGKDALFVAAGDRNSRLIWSVLAAQSLGATVVPVSAEFSPDDLAELLEGRRIAAAFAENRQQLKSLVTLDPQLIPRIVFDDAHRSANAESTRLLPYDALREPVAGKAKLALGRLAVSAGRLLPQTVAFEFLPTGKRASGWHSISHGALIEGAHVLSQNMALQASAEIVVELSFSSASNAALAFAAWLDVGFTLVTVEG